MLDVESSTSTSNNATVAHVASRNTWHNRLGHLYFNKLDRLKHLFQCRNDGVDSYCLICTLAKQKRLTFISHNHLSQCAFNLIHCDTWGPYHVLTHAGYGYFLTLVDDYTRFTWVFLMRHKSEARNIISKFFNVVKT